MARRNNLTPEEIHAREHDEAKKTIAIAKDIKQGISAATIKSKWNVSESDIITRLATSTKQMHEILEVKGLVSLTLLSAEVSKMLTGVSQDTETQTHMMAHNHRGGGLPMSQAVEKTHREQDAQGELMRYEQYGIKPDVAKLLS